VDETHINYRKVAVDDFAGGLLRGMGVTCLSNPDDEALFQAPANQGKRGLGAPPVAVVTAEVAPPPVAPEPTTKRQRT
jgi:hypothetical protein